MDTNVITALIALAGSVLVVGLTQLLAGRNNLAQALLADQRLEKQAAQATTRESQEAERRDKREALQWEQVAAREAAQTERVAQQAAVQWARQQDDKWAALLMAKREEFLGLALESEQLMLAHLMAHHAGQVQSSVTLSDPCAASARRAYVVALLYLADVLPLAKAFQLGTVELQLALMAEDKSSLGDKTKLWRDSIKGIEAAMAAQSQATSGDS